ncbi:fimbrial chaparone [Proteus mirabilis]|uniref:Fimbrial chaparone n=1 Tax=Proteus mirabilis TaxID=584 RepID=A0A379GIM5_PROMI|nr:fimbrial chaparone [Proteus mirabilis]
MRIAKITSIAQTDRESLFYINSKAIPIAESKHNSIHISIKSVFKLFYRPHGLTETVEEATKKIIFSINNKKEMIIKNNSEYYFTIINIFSNGEKKEISVMLSPFSEINIGKNHFGTAKVGWSYINDFGNEVNINIKNSE